MTFEPLYINAVYEDAISFAVIKQLLKCSSRPFVIDDQYCKNGSSYIKNKIHAFHKAARYQPFIILLDADAETCPLTVLNKTISEELRHTNCIFRIVVREIETWLLADCKGLSIFLGVPLNKIPRDVENISDPKRLITTLARNSTKRLIREGIAPPPGSTAHTSAEYNVLLSQFVKNQWNIEAAADNSESLRRAISAVKQFAANN